MISISKPINIPVLLSAHFLLGSAQANRSVISVVETVPYRRSTNAYIVALKETQTMKGYQNSLTTGMQYTPAHALIHEFSYMQD